MHRSTTISILAISVICLIVSAVFFILGSSNDIESKSDSSIVAERNFDSDVTDRDSIQSRLQSTEALLADAQDRITQLSRALSDALAENSSVESSSTTDPSAKTSSDDLASSDSEVNALDKASTPTDLDSVSSGSGEVKTYSLQWKGSEPKSEDEIRAERNEKMGIDDWTASRLTEIEKAYAENSAQIYDQIGNGTLTVEEGERLLSDLKRETAAQVDSLGLNYEQVEAYVDHGGINGPQQQDTIGAMITLGDEGDARFTIGEEIVIEPAEPEDNRDSETSKVQLSAS